MSELKNCPFCDGDASYSYRDVANEDTPSNAISCENHYCKVQPNTMFFVTLEEAIEAWNTRY